MADDRRGPLEELALHGLEGGPGVGAELVAQRPAVGLVPGQGGRRSRGGRLGAQQLGQHLLVPGTHPGQVGEGLGSLGMAAQPAQGQSPGPHQGDR